MLAVGTKKKVSEKVPLITRRSICESQQHLRVLLVEDNMINQRLAIHILEKSGHSIFVANYGQEALNLFEKNEMDLILMDIQMPRMDGFKATALIRSIEKDKGTHIPIVAMTACVMKGDRERGLRAGMDEYIAKPLKSESLFDAMKRAITKVKMKQ